MFGRSVYGVGGGEIDYLVWDCGGDEKGDLDIPEFV